MRSHPGSTTASSDELSEPNRIQIPQFEFLRWFLVVGIVGNLLAILGLVYFQTFEPLWVTCCCIFGFAVLLTVCRSFVLPRLTAASQLDWVTIVAFCPAPVFCGILVEDDVFGTGLTVIAYVTLLTAICFVSNKLYVVWSIGVVLIFASLRSWSGKPLEDSEWVVFLSMCPAAMFVIRTVVLKFYDQLDATRKDQARLIRELQSSLDMLTSQREDLDHSRSFLWQTEFHLNAILRHAPLVLCVMDKDGVYIESKGNGLAKLGLKENELVGKSFDQIYAGHDRVCEAIQKALAGESSQVHASLAEGLHHEIRYQPFHDSNGTQRGIVGVGVDISEYINEESKRRVLEEQVFQSRKIESLGSLAGGVAHDFNNYLMAIVSFTESLKQGIEKGIGQQNQQELLGNANSIQATAMSAAGVCQQMLVLAGKTSESKTECDLNEIIRVSKPLLLASLPSQIKIDIQTWYTPVTAMVDELLVQRALFNVFKNAVEAIGDDQPGELAITTTIETTTADMLHDCVFVGDMVEGAKYGSITVQDSGRGMDSETQARVFEPYFSTKSDGHGFGLAITSGVVSRHSGVIRCQSNDQGTRMSLMFPFVEVRDTDKVVGEKTVPTRSGPMDKVPQRILLVDDKAEVREPTAMALKTLGHTVAAVTSGEEAIEVLRKTRCDFDCVLLDFAMEGMNGAETLSQIRQNGWAIPAIICSGFVNHESLRSDRVDAAAILTKPFSIDELDELIAESCGSERRLD